MLKPLLKSILQSSRLLRLRLAGARFSVPRLLGPNIDCRPAAGRIEFGPGVWIEPGVVLHAFGGSINLGRDVFLGPHTVIYGHGGVEIGDACLFAMHCQILSSNHTVPSYGTDIRSQPDVPKPTKIGRDVWLGAGVTVLGGVTIGNGCVVGAGSVVAKDLPPGSISHGIPAAVRGWREGAPQTTS
jgi:acetyltransferase-like isoleucine patch superfamily enzyme